MTALHPKSTDSLMRYLRDQKGIAISGSAQKRKLMNIGYYHGYKGYRYINTPSKKVAYTKFEEVVSVYDFDSQLKSLFYPSVMLIETAVKNYVLDILVSSTNSENFIDIYNQLLDNYKMFSTKGKIYKNTFERQKAAHAVCSSAQTRTAGRCAGFCACARSARGQTRARDRGCRRTQRASFRTARFGQEHGCKALFHHPAAAV